MSIWLRYQKPFSPASFQFGLFELWRAALKKCSVQIWFSLLLADLIFIVVSNTPAWMHQLGVWFPELKAFQINPPWFQSDPLLVKFTTISKALLPTVLFPLFVSTPVYLGLNLYALRLVYDRPVNLSVLRHYLRIFWWSHITTLFVLSGVVMVPFFYVLFQFQLNASSAYLPQLYCALIILLAVMFILAVLFSMTYLLIFAGRLSVFNALSMSYKATKTHFWHFAALILLSYVVVRLRVTTYYFSDILLMPPTIIAWMLLYKRIYGEAGLVE